HRGEDTAWLAELPGVVIHAFEPDPRNSQPPRSNLTLHRTAVADRDGRGPLLLSVEGWGQEWTHSSSIKRPKNHLQRFPVSFGDTVEVELVALDSFHRELGLDVVDFIWADVQGAEGEMVRGGRETLARTRYLYTEYSDHELYEGQATLAELLELLPDFRVLELWPEDVLLENRRLAA
ncbi:MAG TPA: FkbM family methyltransferase, partial [Gaiellaceae bacterium]|nr:FkbM family methyltransferase [Gaiellaceae bacterium]